MKSKYHQNTRESVEPYLEGKIENIQKQMEQLVSAAATQPKQSLADFMQSQIDLKKLLEDVPGQLPS